jgi:hypothetical protein
MPEKSLLITEFQQKYFKNTVIFIPFTGGIGKMANFIAKGCGNWQSTGVIGHLKPLIKH